MGSSTSFVDLAPSINPAFSPFVVGSGGGGSGAIVGFKDYTVTGGQTVTIVVGDAGAAGNGSTANNTIGNITGNSGGSGGASTITVGNTLIATANGGGGGNAGGFAWNANDANATRGNAGSAGTASIGIGFVIL